VTCAPIHAGREGGAAEPATPIALIAGDDPIGREMAPLVENITVSR